MDRTEADKPGTQMIDNGEIQDNDISLTLIPKGTPPPGFDFSGSFPFSYGLVLYFAIVLMGVLLCYRFFRE